MKLKTLNICVLMEKNHSNQAPTCLKNALLKISINFRMDYVGVLSSSLGTLAIQLNIDFRAQIGSKTETDKQNLKLV